MKKYINIIAFTIILCMVCGCKSSEPSKLEKQYPDSKILKRGNGYAVISENVDYEHLEIQNAGYSDKVTYDTFEQLKSALYTGQAIVFAGRKTDRSRQYIPVNENGYVDDLYFTESVVEVKTPYFGDIEAGQEILLHEYYAVFSDESGNKTLNTTDSITVANEERLFVMFTSGKSELFERDRDKYYNLIYPVPLGEADERRGAGAEVYKKYYINNDTAVDKAELARGILKWEERKINNADSFTKAQIDQAKKGKAVLDSGASSYEQLAEGLSEQHKELINRLAVRYGER